MTPAIILITGIQAAGKSTVAQLLAERLPRSVHVRGDLFRRMVVNGRADMTPEPSELSGPPASGLTEQRRPRAPASRRAAQGGKTPGTGPRTPSGARQSDAALAQLRLRHRLTAATCDAYFREGFTVVAQDVVLGEHLTEMVAMIEQRPLLVVVLAPRPEAVAAREAARAKNTYDRWTIGVLDRGLRETTPRIGLWLDTSGQTPEETVAEILARAWQEAHATDTGTPPPSR